MSFNIDTTGSDSTYKYTGSSHRIEDLIDDYNELISSLDTIYYDDWYVEDIIFDEVLALTADNGKSVEDVVEDLSGRISIYMGEKW